MRIRAKRQSFQAAFTLAETVVSMALTGLMVSGIVSGFLQSARQAEWSAYSYAAQAQALWRLEQVRAAAWDPLRFPQVDDVKQSNFTNRVEILDIPGSGGNITYATNKTFITDISTAPPLRLIVVECTWRFPNRGLYTNVVRTYRTTDQ
jgi:type II secretory pathway pseudopilin PulG